jgi:DNA-binding transcriptional regulator GbsR (MarR family)
MASTLPRSSPSASPAALVVAGERSADVVAFEQAMVELFVDAAELLSVPKSVAAIYGIVFASPVPLSFADIESRLDISKGSVSTGLRLLREVGAVKEVSTEADKAELFEPELEMRKLAAHFIEHRLQRQLDSGKGRLKRLSEGAGAFERGHQKVIRDRLQTLQRWDKRTRALLPIVRTFLKLS